MPLKVTELDDPVAAEAQAGSFLRAAPPHHNLALTILGQSREEGLAGRFWVVREGDRVVGFALQSPPGMRVVLARMEEEVVCALAAALDPPLPGVQGDANSASTFAGHFALAHHVSIDDVDPGRLYQLARVEPVAQPAGVPRVARADECELIAEWLLAFGRETGEPTALSVASVAGEVGRRIARGAFWLWDDGDPVSLVGVREPVAGFARVGPVFTPTEHRGRGYAAAAVAHVSERFVARGLGCVLYTHLDNPTSNAIYRRIGYEPIAEVLSYRFA